MSDLSFIPCYPSKKWINDNPWYIAYHENKMKQRKKITDKRVKTKYWKKRTI